MWIARDKKGNLWAFTTPKIHLNEYGVWVPDNLNNANIVGVFREELPELTWENGPIEVELTPIKKKNEADSVDEYIEYLESLEDDFAMELRSDTLYYIGKKMKGGEWKTFEDENLDEIKRFLLECIHDDYEMMKTYFPKECRKKSDMNYLDQWFDFKKYKLDGFGVAE